MHEDEKKMFGLAIMTFIIGLMFGLFDSYLIWPLIIGAWLGLHTALDIGGGNSNSVFIALNVSIAGICSFLGWYLF